MSLCLPTSCVLNWDTVALHTAGLDTDHQGAAAPVQHPTTPIHSPFAVQTRVTKFNKNIANTQLYQRTKYSPCDHNFIGVVVALAGQRKRPFLQTKPTQFNSCSNNLPTELGTEPLHRWKDQNPLTSCSMTFSTSSRKDSFGFVEWMCFINLAMVSVSVSDSKTKPFFSCNTPGWLQRQCQQVKLHTLTSASGITRQKTYN